MRPPKIIIAACKYEDWLVLGPRHWDKTMWQNFDNISASFEQPISPIKFVEGFIDQYGKFYSRIEAMNMVNCSKQIVDLERNGGDDDVLYSEGLY